MSARFALALDQLIKAQRVNEKRSKATNYMRRWRAAKRQQQRKETTT